MFEPILIGNTTRACYWRTPSGFVATGPDETPGHGSGAHPRLDALMKLKGESAQTIAAVQRQEVLRIASLPTPPPPPVPVAIARAILEVCGADARDFHALPSSVADDLAEAARFCGYRKPRNANGSTARYFHARLVRQAKES